MAALKYWVWLTTLPGLTNRSKLLLLEHFPSPVFSESQRCF